MSTFSTVSSNVTFTPNSPDFGSAESTRAVSVTVGAVESTEKVNIFCVFDVGVIIGKAELSVLVTAVAIRSKLPSASPDGTVNLTLPNVTASSSVKDAPVPGNAVFAEPALSPLWCLYPTQSNPSKSAIVPLPAAFSGEPASKSIYYISHYKNAKPGYDVYVTFKADGPSIYNNNTATSARGDDSYFTLFYENW